MNSPEAGPSMQTDFVIYLDDRSGVSRRMLHIAAWAVRIALAIAFLSAVGDRFGLWGPPGTANVSWGSVANFNAYVAKLNWFLPPGCIPVVAWTSTAAEVVLAIALLVGWRLRWASLLSAALLLAFAGGMIAGLGIKAPLNYSVFTAASAAFLLFAIQPTGGPSCTPLGDAHH